MTFPLQWHLLFLLSIPQVLITIVIGLTLFNIQISWRRILIIAILNGAFSYFIRFIPIILGVHAFINVIVFTLIAAFLGKIRFMYALCAMTAGLMVLAVIEGCTLAVFFKFFNVSTEILINKQIYLLEIFGMEAVVALGLYFLIKRYNFTIWNLGLKN